MKNDLNTSSARAPPFPRLAFESNQTANGGKNMSKKQHQINVNGTLADVTEELYLEYYRFERRMRYFEHDIKTETAIRDKDGRVTGYSPSKEDSLERILAKGGDFDGGHPSAEDSALSQIMSDMLHKALNKLFSEERRLIDLLYFSNGGKGLTERDCAKRYGISKTALHTRKERILGKMKTFFENN